MLGLFFDIVNKYLILLPARRADGAPTMRKLDENLIKAQSVLSLQPQEFYMITYSGKYKGRTANVSKSRLTMKYPETGAG